MILQCITDYVSYWRWITTRLQPIKNSITMIHDNGRKWENVQSSDDYQGVLTPGLNRYTILLLHIRPQKIIFNVDFNFSQVPCSMASWQYFIPFMPFFLLFPRMNYTQIDTLIIYLTWTLFKRGSGSWKVLYQLLTPHIIIIVIIKLFSWGCLFYLVLWCPEVTSCWY